MRDGKAYIFEINARFSTTNVIRATCDYNEVDLLIENFLFGSKRYIKNYRRAVAIAYFDYVYMDLDKFEEAVCKEEFSSGGYINNWL